jgi:hypothetical protein
VQPPCCHTRGHALHTSTTTAATRPTRPGPPATCRCCSSCRCRCCALPLLQLTFADRSCTRAAIAVAIFIKRWLAGPGCSCCCGCGPVVCWLQRGGPQGGVLRI